MLLPETAGRHFRPAAEAALLGWLAALINDWFESAVTRPKGSTYMLVLVGSLPSLVCGFFLAVHAREKLHEDLREHAELPPPRRIFALAMGRAFRGVVVNVPAYLAFLSSHPVRVVGSFLLAAAVSGAWLARSVLVRELPERASRPWAALVAALPAGALAALASSAVLVVVRMRVDDALSWGFSPVPQCGGVEIANATVAILPVAVLFAGTLALGLLVARGLADATRLPDVLRRTTAPIFVAVGCLAFASAAETFFVAKPPGACRNTPHASPLAAILAREPPAFLHTTLRSSGAAAGGLAALVLLVATRRRRSSEEQPCPEVGPYRTAISVRGDDRGGPRSAAAARP